MLRPRCSENALDARAPKACPEPSDSDPLQPLLTALTGEWQLKLELVSVDSRWVHRNQPLNDDRTPDTPGEPTGLSFGEDEGRPTPWWARSSVRLPVLLVILALVSLDGILKF